MLTRPDRLLRPTEAAERLGLKDPTIRKYAAQGRVPFVRVGRSLRFRESDITLVLARGLAPESPNPFPNPPPTFGRRARPAGTSGVDAADRRLLQSWLRRDPTRDALSTPRKRGADDDASPS